MTLKCEFAPLLFANLLLAYLPFPFSIGKSYFFSKLPPLAV